MIRVYIVEDHTFIVDGLMGRFRHYSDQFQVAGWSRDPGEFIRTAEAGSFDIILLDLWFPEQDPLENLMAIQRAFPEKPVVVLTGETSAYWIRTMMQHDVKAYLMKDISRQEFKLVLEKVYHGKTVFPDMVLQKPSVGGKNGFLSDRFNLKPSEQPLVRKISQGETLKQIADWKHVIPSAIEKALGRIRTRMNVQTNAELIRVLKENHII